MVHALAQRHVVHTLTASDWSPGETNTFYGTAIDAAAVQRHVIPAPWRWLAGLPEDRLTRLRLCSVLHQARAIASQYDLLICADHFAVFPRPGIQYVYFPAKLQPPAARLKPLVDVYYALCDRLLGAPWTDAIRNTTVVTSQWTVDGLKRLGEVLDAMVLYPPVVDPGVGLPWQERDNTFLCVGRFVPSKRIDTSIAIVTRVRAGAIPNARLVVVGSAVDSAYHQRIREEAGREGTWIEFREDLSRSELNALMRRSRYGIQAMKDEHFGMATAEMAAAGCLVFAHDSGGSPEVLNHERELLWTTEDDAVEKISAINSAAALALRLRAHARTFSTDAFVERFLGIVDSKAGHT
jgi:glycosyltransferase involved in cell wall biosynthesis